MKSTRTTKPTHVYTPSKTGERNCAVQHLLKVCRVHKKPNLSNA